MTEKKKPSLLHSTDEVLVLKSKEPETKVVTNDNAVADACAGGEWRTLGTTEITEIRESLAFHMGAIHRLFPKLIAECPHATRLAVTCQVLRAVLEHAREGGGSMRHLIYNRLGFVEGDYVPLHLAGATVISNNFDLTGYDEDGEVRRVCEKLGLNFDELVAKMREPSNDKPAQ